MNNIGFEVQRTDRNLLQKLWSIVKFLVMATAFAWWVNGSLLAAFMVYAFGLSAYQGRPVIIEGQNYNAGWFFIAAALFFYWFALRLIISAVRGKS